MMYIVEIMLVSGLSVVKKFKTKEERNKYFDKIVEHICDGKSTLEIYEKNEKIVFINKDKIAAIVKKISEK